MRNLNGYGCDSLRFAVQNEIFKQEESSYEGQIHGIVLVCSRMNCATFAEVFGHRRSDDSIPGLTLLGKRFGQI